MLLAASIGEDVLRAVLQGTPPGTVYALVALGFVLTYKTSGVFNLAFGAQAYISAALFFQLQEKWGWSVPPALLVSVFLVAPGLGLVLERLIFRHLRTATAVAKLVVALGLSVALPAIFDLLSSFEAVAGNTPTGIVPDGATTFYDPFGVYAFSRDELVAMSVAVVGMVSLGLLFRYSAIGLRMRSVVESPRMTELNGISADRVAAFSWALSSLFAGMAGVLIAPRFNTLFPSDYFNLVVVAVAAAAIGHLVSLPRALLGGLGLGIFIAFFDTFVPRWSDDYTWLRPFQENLTPSMPFVVLFGVIVLSPTIHQTRQATDPLAGVDPPPKPLAATARSAFLTHGTHAFGAVFFLVTGFVVFRQADAYWLNLITQAVILSTIYLSITVMTGLAGEISLCQGTFAAIGGFTVFQLADRHGMSVVLAAVIGAGLAAAAGALLSLPLLRLSGIWIAIATLAFAFFFDAVMIKFSWVGGGDTALATGTRVPRPVIGPWDLADDKAFLVLALIVFAVLGLAVIQIREGTVGRTLGALRGSRVAAESIGISQARARITVFAVSAFIAALGGAMLSIHQENVNYTSNFAPYPALFWMVLVISLGSRTVEGAAQAGAAFALFNAIVLQGAVFGWILRSEARIPGLFPLDDNWRFILFGLGTIQFARHPEGLVENGKRKASARVDQALAWWQRRHEPGSVVEEVGRVTAVLEAVGIRKKFSGIVALDDVAMSVDPGERVGLIGPNGAGKTTFFNCVLGVLRADGGEVRLHGEDVSGLRVHERARRGIGRTFQRVELFSESTVRDHLLVAERTRRGDGRLWKDLIGRGRPRPDEVRACDEVLDLLGLRDVAEEPIEHLSLGKGRLVEVGRALMTEPVVLLLDEPSSGLDREETADLARTLRAVQEEQGFAILLVEHDVELVADFTDRCYVLDFGSLIAQGPTADVLASDIVRAAYLGDFDGRSTA